MKYIFRNKKLVHNDKTLVARLIGLLLVVVSMCGCVSPNTGRVRDAHLLYASNEQDRKISEVYKFGPFYDKVVTHDGATRESYRPLIYTKVSSAKEEATAKEIFWPLYSENTRRDYRARRFLLWFSVDFDTTDDESRYRRWLFPIWFDGKTKTGENYAALFPIYGNVKEMYFDYFNFVLWPIWQEYGRGSQHTWSVLWPIVSRTKGNGISAFRVFPFYGTSTREGKYDSEFILWPIWSHSKYSGVNPGYSWMLFPVCGRVNTENETRWLFVPPLFSYAKGRGDTPNYRRINCPWPLVMILDKDNVHKRHFIPFYMHQYDDNKSLDSTWIMWPFYRQREAYRGRLKENIYAFNPIFFSSSIKADSNKDGVYDERVEDYMRIWPLYSERLDDVNTYVRVPDFSFSRRKGLLDRNLLDMFSLYTFGRDRERERVDHELLWGLYTRGYGKDYSKTHIFPFYNHSRDGDISSWSLFYGLIGKDRKGEESKWRFLWFLGGLDAGGNK